MKNKIFRFITQPFADLCVYAVKIVPYPQKLEWYRMGLALDLYLILFHEIYLD